MPPHQKSDAAFFCVDIYNRTGAITGEGVSQLGIIDKCTSFCWVGVAKLRIVGMHRSCINLAANN